MAKWGDVIYEVWRDGGNPDAVDYNRVREAEYWGDTAEEIAHAELRRQEKAHARMINGILPDEDDR